jgi:hypothetical protein
VTLLALAVANTRLRSLAPRPWMPQTPFMAQQGTSYFALENDHHVLVGLDSAYASSGCDLDQET